MPKGVIKEETIMFRALHLYLRKQWKAGKLNPKMSVKWLMCSFGLVQKDADELFDEYARKAINKSINYKSIEA